MNNTKLRISFEDYCKKNNREYLLEEWDYDSNKLKPSEVSYGSHKVVNWKCSKGHKYQKDIHSRCQGTGCSKCSGIIFKKRNKVFEEYPMFIDELDTDFNNFDDVKNLTCCSEKKVYWKCPKRHKYAQTIKNKVLGKGCLICNNKIVLKGYNDCKTWCEINNKTDVLMDWDYDLNKYKPEELTYGSSVLVNFKCHVCGNKWKTKLYSRLSQNTGCRECKMRVRSSFPEQAIYYYLKKYFLDCVNGDRNILAGKELDIYIPSKRVAIEYDGETWHTSSNKDLEKSELCFKNKIKLFRVREKNCPKINDPYSIIFEYTYQNWQELEKIIENILELLNIRNANININRDELRIKEQFYSIINDKSLGSLYPEIAKEWHPTKNGSITPNQVSAETHDSYYWLCPSCGNTYKAMVKNRVRVKSGCPKCGKDKSAKSQMIKIKNLDTGEIFENANEAAKKYNCGRAAIIACCRKITNTSNGYHWEYVDREKAVRSSTQKQKTQKKIINMDTGIVYENLVDAFQKTGIHNIQAVCSGRREKAGGYHWKYMD